MIRLAVSKGSGWTTTRPRNEETVKTSEDYGRFVRVLDEGLRKRGIDHDESCLDAALVQLSERDRVVLLGGIELLPAGSECGQALERDYRKFGDTVIARRARTVGCQSGGCFVLQELLIKARRILLPRLTNRYHDFLLYCHLIFLRELHGNDAVGN